MNVQSEIQSDVSREGYLILDGWTDDLVDRNILCSLFRLSISSRIDFEIHGAQFLLTLMVIAGAW